MSIEHNEAPEVKAGQEDKTSQALLQDVMDDLNSPMEEGRRRRGGGYPYPNFGPIHIDRPTSKVSALQYEVRDGKINIKSR